MSKINFKVDKDCEMMEITVDDKIFFHGNFWDFSFPDDLYDLLKKSGQNVSVEKKDYEEW